MSVPRLLIEEWLPAQAIGVECMRERSTGQQPPDKRLHVWWARRPLTAARAAVLASVLPADFDHACFERLLGFYADGASIVRNARKLDANSGAVQRIVNPHGPRAFSNVLREPDVLLAHAASSKLWGDLPTVLDPMAGGGSIPLESARLGLPTLANEYNPVACSVLEATINYPLRFGAGLAVIARKWANLWRERFVVRMEPFYRADGIVPAYSYIFARTVPCPDTGYPTPLVPDWSLLKPKGGQQVVAEPVNIDASTGNWTIRVREIGKRAGQLARPPAPTYSGGAGVSLFTGTPIPSDYIKAVAQQGRMGSVLYAVAIKAVKLEFRPAAPSDNDALVAAAHALGGVRLRWEREGIIPSEAIPGGDKTKEPLNVGHRTWADLFSPRQLLALGVLVEELAALRSEIEQTEGKETADAVVHLLALALDKFVNYNSMLASWHAPRQVIRSVFDRHDFAFKSTFAEMAATTAGGGLAWAADNVIDAYEKLSELPHADKIGVVEIDQGSAAHLLHLDDQSVAAVVVDPPYADNVQYAELADFFYVWLKRTQGYRRPEWFSTYLCDHDEEAVVNISRQRQTGDKPGLAKTAAHIFYQQQMAAIFAECRRVLRDDGVLTVMFTHKQQEAWSALFGSLIAAGFTITATWPVRTESEHSLHQAKKNAAQSTVILVARKRPAGAGRAYLDDALRGEIRAAAQSTAARLQSEGLNPIDQLVGSFGPAMAVFSRFDQVRTDTGDEVPVADAIQLAADAVADWRVAQLSARGLQGVDPASRFALLCWDVLQAAEFRFNEAMLLGRSVGMGAERLVEAGLINRQGDKVKLMPAADRRRTKPIRSEQEQATLFDLPGRGKRRPSRTVHPMDEYFVNAIDMCHALALRYADAGGGQAGIGAAKGMAMQQAWGVDSVCARLMEALVHAAPPGVRFGGSGRQTTAADEFPEFRAWHALLQPLFGLQPPDWQPEVELAPKFAFPDDEADQDADDDATSEGEE